MDIKVLGPGCKKCEQTAKIVQETLSEAGVDAKVEKITDLMQIAGYGVMSTPSVVVDGKVTVVGKVPSKKDVLSWVKK
ncbi:MAG: TM0996/MTH895 family glutaredoxin-like protein [Desulfatibacillum sp.]|nr:TM0996/MTH895 family glutaredoxin-like protein [Desulfatibacillum sp.]